MTIVMIREKRGIHSIRISGHAKRQGYTQENDVCVAVSILAQTLVQTLRNNSGKFCCYSDKIGDDACVYVSVGCDGRMETFVRAVFESARTGLEMLADMYPEQVRVIEGAEKFSM